ncbi:winged helix-turn-helix domain-containing protein [Wenzhouxiangella marina]|uniref:Uncharacterized protein n=1 Tax=Wenzhouxiangella marina TaxID=1579979 RepID=A0A0K0XYL8_9GAMM|nr:winged helix-turn-helix domain-containing protein [Wenzhouxiangella marina]AKS42783.1 hypothetical protein WM2015_2421 [Wenzhouxiangella marina]MBB6087539.1 DNA-binding winged helix-turn-helix (wHTH) protein/TolB-like protein [Wenzhouxiangella marina]
MRAFSGCRFDGQDGRLTGPGGEASLRPQAGRLLERFLEAPGEVLDRETLIAAVWDEGSVVDFESGLAALMRELRQALEQVGLEASLIETVPRRGYRFHGRIDGAAAAEAVTEPEARSGWRRWGGGMLAVFLLILLVVLAWYWNRPVPSSAPPALAILPFEQYGDDSPEASLESRQGRLLADTLLAELWAAELPDLELIGRATLRPYQGREDVARRVADDLGVDLLLEGLIAESPTGGLRVDARLVYMPRGTVLWSSTWASEGDEALPVGTVAQDFVAELTRAWPAIRDERFAVSE